MKFAPDARLLQILYRVALSLVVAMLVLIPVQIIACPFALLIFFLSPDRQQEYKRSFSLGYPTQFRLE